MFITDALLDPFLDLVLGSACVACQRPGRPLCLACTTALPTEGICRTPTPGPQGLVPTYATGDYDDVLRALVIAHKERRVLALTKPLGQLVRHAAQAALSNAVVSDAVASDAVVNDAVVSDAVPVVLVPVPSRPAAVRARGHDPTLSMTRVAAGSLRDPERQVVVARLLRLRPGVVDQSGLDRSQRAANLAGSMAIDTVALRRLAARLPRAHVVICDDVITTGATLREAQRALEAVGVAVTAGACVAATRRRQAAALPSETVRLC